MLWELNQICETYNFLININVHNSSFNDYISNQINNIKYIKLNLEVYPVDTAPTLHKIRRLEAFSVNDAWARLVVFLFRDPHLLEGALGG